MIGETTSALPPLLENGGTQVLMLAQQALSRDPTVMMALGILGVAALVLGLSNVLRDVRRQETKRVDDRLMGVSSQRQGGRSIEQVRASLVKKSAIAAGGGFLRALGRFRPIDNLQKACFQAALDWNAARLVTRMVFLSFLVSFVLVVLNVDVVRAVIISVCIFVAPIIFIRYRKKKRLETLIEQLPDVFDAIVSALRAGQSLPNAIGLVAEQLPEPSHTEFSLVYQEQNLGVPIEEALNNMRRRLDQLDVSFFVTAVQVQKQSGGDLAEVLENIGSIIRARIKLFGQVRALTAEGRLSGWILMALPPIMLVVILFLNPTYAERLLKTEVGHWLLFGAGVSQLLGLWMIRKIVQIEV